MHLFTKRSPQNYHDLALVLHAVIAMAEKEIYENTAPEPNYGGDKDVALRQGSIAATQKSRWERSWPVIACGSGNNVTTPSNAHY